MTSNNTTSTTTTAALTKYQQLRADAAMAALADRHGYDTMSLATHVGSLEWHLGEMLALVRELTGGDTEN